MEIVSKGLDKPSTIESVQKGLRLTIPRPGSIEDVVECAEVVLGLRRVHLRVGQPVEHVAHAAVGRRVLEEVAAGRGIGGEGGGGGLQGDVSIRSNTCEA